MLINKNWTVIVIIIIIIIIIITKNSHDFRLSKVIL